MVQKTSPFIESKYGWNLGESGWNTGADENFLKFAFMLDNGVDGVVSSLPQTPVNGSSYYLTTDNRFYFVVDGTYYSSPCPKWFTFKLKTTGQKRIYDGSGVLSLPSDIDVSGLLTSSSSAQKDFAQKLADVSTGTSLIGYNGSTLKKFLDNLNVPVRADGSDSTQDFINAFSTSKKVTCQPGKTYYVSNLQIPVNGLLDLQGATLKRSVGANYAVIMDQYHGTIINGEINGDGLWKQSTFANADVSGVTNVTLANATGFQAGMRVVYSSQWADGGIETNEIASISGNVLTLRLPTKGAIISGERILADFPLVNSSGSSSYYGFGSNLFIRNCLFCFESGKNASGGNNNFSAFDNFICEGYIGAALVLSPNSAAESFNTMHMNGGRTSTSNFTGNGSTNRFAIPYILKKKIYRWGSEPSVRYIVNGAQQPTSSYTIDLNTFEVVANIVPTNGSTIQIVNYEYAAFNIIGQAASPAAPSSIERLGSAIAIAANINAYFENCELGFFSNVQLDTAGYCNTLLVNCSNFHLRATDSLYAPFDFIFDGCNNCSLVGFATSLLPDAAEFAVTANKRELIVRDTCRNITVDYLSWNSATGYTRAVSNLASPAEAAFGRKLALSEAGLAVGGPVSGKAMFYGSAGNVQVPDDGQGLYFLLGGYKYIQANASNAVMRVGSVGSNGSLELTGASGVRIILDGPGRVLLPSIPTSASGLPSGALWKDTANGNVIKIV